MARFNFRRLDLSTCLMLSYLYLTVITDHNYIHLCSYTPHDLLPRLKNATVAPLIDLTGPPTF